MTTISRADCMSQIYAAPLPQRTPREERIAKIAALTRAIHIAQLEIPIYGQKAIDFIARKKAERDALMLTTDDGSQLDPADPAVIKTLGTPESRAEVEDLIGSFEPEPAPEFTAPLPEAMPEPQPLEAKGYF